MNNSYRKNFPRLTFLKFQVENTHFLIGLSVYNLNFKGFNFGLRLLKKFKKSIQQVDDKLNSVFVSSIRVEVDHNTRHHENPSVKFNA